MYSYKIVYIFNPVVFYNMKWMLSILYYYNLKIFRTWNEIELL